MNRTLAIVTAIALLAVTVILAGSIPGTFTPHAPTITPTPTPTPPPAARGTALRTTPAILGPGDPVLFTGTEDMQNITFEAPDVLRIGDGWGGTYRVAYEVNLANTTGGDVNNSFAVEVDSSIIIPTEAHTTVHAGEMVTLSKNTEIHIPSGAAVRLLNLSWVDSAELIPLGGRSALLRLERVGP